MIAINPLAAFGTRNLQPVRPVSPVVRGSSNTTAAPNAPPLSNTDKVTIGGPSRMAGEGLYTRKGTLISSTARQEEFDLTIQTAEGDTATLHLSQSAGSKNTVKARESARGSSVESLQENFGALDVQISVKGALNAEEKQAIDKLMQEVSGVADTFFAGDTNAANTQADALKLQDGVLSGFSMNLRTSEMSRVSAVYEDVAQFTAPPPPRTPIATPQQGPTSTALTNADLLKGLRQLFADLVGKSRDALAVTDAVDKTPTVAA